MAKNFYILLALSMAALADAFQWSVGTTPSYLPNNCPEIKCGKSKDFHIGQCSYFKKEREYKVLPCGGIYQICKFNDNYQDSICGTKDYATRNAGEYCEQPFNCVVLPGHSGGMCNGYICQGLGLNSACATTSQCNPGTYCSNGTCTQNIKLGEACEEDEQCEGDALCLKNDSQGVCTAMFSIKAGEQVTCDNFTSFLCETGLCYPDEGGLGRCMEAVNNLNSATCFANSDCNSSFDTNLNTYLYSECVCAMNDDNDAYCARLPGDPEGEAFYQALQSILGKDGLKNCNSADKLSPFCVKVNFDADTFNQYYRSYLNLRLWPVVNDNDQCQLQTLYPDYYYFVYGPQEDEPVIRRFFAYLGLWQQFKHLV